jgi:hypothetical protein
MKTEPKTGVTAAAAAGVDERWFLRIDGHNYGPAPRAELENFLRPPRLCSVMEVKCGDGVWFTIARHDTLDKVLAKVGIEIEPVKQPEQVAAAPSASAASARSGRSTLSKLIAWTVDFCEGLTAWLIHHWVVTTIVFVIVIVNSLALFALRDPHVGDREILARYEALWRDARKLGDQETSEEDWRNFAGPAIAELEPIVKQLALSASVHQPIRQNLLFAGRDHLLKILKGERPPTVAGPQVRLLEQRLKLAHEQLADGPTLPPVTRTKRVP